MVLIQPYIMYIIYRPMILQQLTQIELSTGLTRNDYSSDTHATLRVRGHLVFLLCFCFRNYFFEIGTEETAQLGEFELDLYFQTH